MGLLEGKGIMYENMTEIRENALESVRHYTNINDEIVSMVGCAE